MNDERPPIRHEVTMSATAGVRAWIKGAKIAALAGAVAVGKWVQEVKSHADAPNDHRTPVVLITEVGLIVFTLSVVLGRWIRRPKA